MSRNAQYRARNPRLFYQVICLSLALLFTSRAKAQEAQSFNGRTPGDARVVIVEDPGALYNLVPVPETVQSMVDRGITNLTHRSTVNAAWNSLVSTNDIVGLKVLSAPGRNSGTRPDVVAAVVQDLLAAGLPPNHIIIWDRHTTQLRLAGFFELGRRFGVRVQGSAEAGYDEKVFYDTPLLGTLAYGDFEFGKTGQGIGRKSYVSKLVAQDMTKIINLTTMLHHNVVGVSGNLYSLAFGSVDNTDRFEYTPENLSRAVPEIYALPVLGDRVVLNIVDALICQYDGQNQGELHYSTVLNQLRFSKDPVALDVLSLQEINHQRETADVPVTKSVELYSNASLLEIGISDPHRIQVEKVR